MGIKPVSCKQNWISIILLNANCTFVFFLRHVVHGKAIQRIVMIFLSNSSHMLGEQLRPYYETNSFSFTR